MRDNIVAQVVSPGKVEFLRRETALPGPGDALIRIRSSAICGSDLHIFRGMHPSAPLPVTIGHELSGDVEAVGRGVEGLAPGTRVTVEPVIACGNCAACCRGEYGYCEQISFTYREGAGAMARYITVRASCIHKLPEGLSYNAGALVEPLAVAVHAVGRADLRLGQRVAVLGAGAIGLLITALCRQRGILDIAVADLSPQRLALAAEWGATCTVDATRADFLSVLDKWSGGRGVERSFECVGSEATLRQAMLCLSKNGLATVAGIFEKPEAMVPVTRYVTHEIRVQGSQGYCWDFPTALGMTKVIDLNRLVTHEFPLEQLPLALKTALERSSGAVKVLLHNEEINQKMLLQGS
jgi:(R,R)-butanediol dehydrogenase/meso-butanediol dehydrogenase/diacetyl reductase/L-iditol 2-dehydrogenase